MELYQAIHERRSLRKFKADPVPEALLTKLCDAAQWAPSWAHTQCVEVVAVADAKGKADLQTSLPDRNPAYKAMVEAPLAIAFCVKLGRAGFKKGEAATSRGDGWSLFDCGLAMQNFMLAAHAEGLATVCVGLFDQDAAGRALGLPEGMEVVALTPLGYPSDTEVNLPPRKPLGEFLHRERYPKA